MSKPRAIDELIGVYNADGGAVGELRYIARKLLGRGHCALCDITHRGFTRRAEWTDACRRWTTPMSVLHLNERPDDVRRASEGHVPCVLARVGEDLVTLLDPADLEACGSSVEALEARMRTAAADHGLAFD